MLYTVERPDAPWIVGRWDVQPSTGTYGALETRSVIS